MNNRLKVRLVVLLVIILALPYSYYLAYHTRSLLVVAFLDVGQGDAIYIESPVGNQVLIDGGLGKSVLRELGSVMRATDRSIDVLVATHPDADHISGLNDVLDRYSVGLFLEPGVSADTNTYQELVSKVKNSKITKLYARRGMVVELGGGAVLEILYPVGDVSGWETNSASIVARLVYGETEVMLTGDAPIRSENALMYMEDGSASLTSDILKAGHHGSKTSTSAEFVRAVAPQYAIISAGKDNRYGHPSPEVVQTLENAGIKILSTAEEGTIIFESDGVNLRIR